MKLKKTKKDIIESIKSVSSKKKNEMFEVDSKVQAVASPSFVDALEMSAKNKQMVIDRMKEKEKERKEFMKQTVERTENTTPKSDDMKKMKMVEAFLNESFKDKLTIKENVFTVLTKSRAELKTLIENARNSGVKYTIGRLAENYEFKYKFEKLTEDIDDVVDQFFVFFKFTENGKTKKELHGPFEDEEKAFEFADSLPEKENGIFWVIEPHEVNTIDMTESKDRLTVEKAKTIAYDKLSYGEYKNLMTMDDDYIIDYVSTELVKGELDESKDSTLKEEKALTTSEFKDFIRDHFNYSFDFEFLDIVAHILNRIDFEEDLDDEIDVAINDSLVYIKDQWTVAEFYVSSPADLDWDDVLNDLSNDIHELAEKITEDEDLTEDKKTNKIETTKYISKKEINSDVELYGDKSFGVWQSVDQYIYKHNPSLLIGFTHSNLTKEEAEKIVAETPKIRGISLSVEPMTKKLELEK